MRRTKEEVAADRELVTRIEASLDHNVAAVERAMIALYEAQTPDERREADTKHSNAVGFTGADARLGTRIVENVILKAKRAGIPEGKRLWGKSLAQARAITKKYVRTQLLALAKEKAAMQRAALEAKVAEVTDEADGRMVDPVPALGRVVAAARGRA